MGCDIHLYKEKKIDGKWVAADEWVRSEYDDDGYEVPWEKRFTKRNYCLFGLLSKGVRTEHQFSFDPRGIPEDACREVATEIECWAGDGHSHSYLLLSDLIDLQKTLQSSTIKITGMKDRDELADLRASIASGSPDWNKLFPYCQCGSNPNYVEFELDVPADFYVGSDLQEIIDSFDGIDGEDHRIVFFFDN